MYIKNFKLIIALLILLGVAACNSAYQGRKVMAFFPNGQVKRVVIYNIKGSDSTAIAEEHYHSTGELKMKGPLKNNQRHGKWKSWFTDGTLWSEGTFDNGLRIDSAISYFPNGKVSMRGFYRQGKMVGVWKVYNEAGVLTGEKEYKE